MHHINGRRRRLEIIPIFVFRIGIDGLSFGLSPRDTPCGISSGCSEGNDGFDISWRCVEWILEDCHSAHGATHYRCDRFHSKRLEDLVVQSIEQSA